MAIETVAGLAAMAPSPTSVAGAQRAGSGDFGTWLQHEIGTQLAEANRQIGVAEGKLQSFAAGETSNLHDLMITLEKAKLSFELVLAVRNKALEAYQEMMRMQI